MEIYWIITFLVPIAILIYKLGTINFNYWKNRNIYYLRPIPFFGNFLDVFLHRKSIGEALGYMYNCTKEPFFGIFVFNKPHLIIRNPKIIKTILVKDFNYFVDRNFAITEHDKLTSEFLFATKGTPWKNIRAKITPLFTSGKLKNMMPIMNDSAEEMIKYLHKKDSMDSIEAKEVCAKFSTEIIAKCAFAINAKSFDNEDAEFRKVGRQMFQNSSVKGFKQKMFFFFPSFVRFMRFKFIEDEVSKFLQDAFWKAVKIREQSGVKGNDLIDIIVGIRSNEEFRKQNNFEGVKVVAQAIQFFAAGFETTSTIMAFFLYEMCLHPEIQGKLRNEIKTTIKNEGCTYDSIMNMKYLDMCLSETLRKYPTLPFLDRFCNADYKIPDTNVVIEEGTPVFIPMFGLHYDPEYFPNPDEFIPDRFAEGNKINSEGYCYFPFGEGPRNCVGARFGILGAKAGLVHILLEYEVHQSKNTPIPVVSEPKSFTLQSPVGLPMKFKRCPLL